MNSIRGISEYKIKVEKSKKSKIKKMNDIKIITKKNQK
jgi:hypothetical protein